MTNKERKLIKKCIQQMNAGYDAVVANRHKKVEAILKTVSKNTRLEQFYFQDQLQVYEFKGKIGSDVTFTKEHREYSPDVFTDSVDLAYKEQKLGRIVVLHEKLRAVHDNTNLSVIAADCQEGNVVATNTKEVARKNLTPKTTRLTVYHNQDQTADEVLDRIGNIIAKSQDKAAVAKKLRKLNLPSKVTIKNKDALAENILNQIYTADREM